MANLKRESSLPPSLRAHLVSGPQQPQGLSPTGSTGTQDEAELPVSPFEPPLPPLLSTSALRPLAPASFPDPRRQYPGYESGAQDPVSLHSFTGSPSTERPGGPSSIPHGSARRYRSPVVSDPTYPTPIRPQGPAYPGSHSLPPALPQVTAARGLWREGEAGPSSLVHSHPYGGLSRQISPGYLPPQPIYRRATEPGYPAAPHAQPGFLGSYERLRPQEPPLGYPLRPTYEVPPYSEASQSRGSFVSLPPMYNRDADGIYPPPGNARAGELDLPPLYSIHSHSSASSDYTRVDDGAYLPRPDLRRRADDDYESNPRRAKVQKKILVACNFCRGRKLRCDGLKPTCCNCIARQITCDYVDHPKRRGPGKAAKGPKPKKRAAKGEQRQSSEPFPSQKPFPTLDEFKFDMRTLAPELRPRGSFDSGVYSSSSHSGGGRHPSQQPSPEGSQGTPQQRRTSRSRKRGPSSEYSPPPESQPKR